MRIEPDQLNQLLRPVFRAQDEQAAEKGGQALACGLPAGPGAATGRVVFTAADAVAWAERGEQVLLVRDFTSPEDIRGMDAAAGHPHRPGRHDQPRGAGRPADGQGLHRGLRRARHRHDARATFSVDDTTVKEGDWISIDGFIGEVIVGKLETRPPEVLQVLLEGSMKPEESRVVSLLLEDHELGRPAAQTARAHQRRPARPGRNAIAFGAQGIGLCRTEHMFFGGDRIVAMREMILADDQEEPREGSRQAPADPARATSPASSGSWRACR